MTLEFSVFVSYSQIAVFLPALEDPFNTWTDQDVENGFSWRPGSVSFKTPEEAGDYRVRIHTNEGAKEQPIASAVSVPFTVPADGLVEIGTISDTKVVEIGRGNYTLTFEVLKSAEQSDLIQLTFVVASEIHRTQDA